MTLEEFIQEQKEDATIDLQAKLAELEAFRVKILGSGLDHERDNDDWLDELGEFYAR